MRGLSRPDDIAAGLDALCAADPRLGAVRALAGEVPLRLSEPGFASLASIIVSQQVSRASADAIFGRFVRLVDPLTPRARARRRRRRSFARPACRGRSSARCWPSARAVADGLDLVHLCDLDADEAIGQLTAVPGIGPWTAEVYLLFCRRPPGHLPGARRRAAERGRPCARPRAAPGREGADREWPNHGRPGAASHRGFSGPIIARRGAGMARRRANRPKKHENHGCFAPQCGREAASHPCHRRAYSIASGVSICQGG